MLLINFLNANLFFIIAKNTIDYIKTWYLFPSAYLPNYSHLHRTEEHILMTVVLPRPKHIIVPFTVQNFSSAYVRLWRTIR